MKNFSKYILEKLKIKKSHFKTNLLPKSKEELIEIIKKEMSITKDFTTNEEQEKIDEDIKEGEE